MAQNKSTNDTLPTTPDSGGERFIGIIPGTYKWTMFGGRDWFNILVTDKRLVFDLITDTTLPWDEYAKKQTEEILSLNKGNFSIELSKIKSFEFISGENINHLCGKYEEINGEMQLQTPKVKYSFYVPVRHLRAARDILSKVGLSSQENQTDSFRGI